MKRHLPLFFAVTFAMLAGAYTQTHAQDDSAADDSAEAQLFSMFENTCMAFAGDSTALKAWADLNMRSIPPNTDDQAFAAFVGRWATDIGGQQVQLSLIDTIWACNITAPDMDGPQIQKNMEALHDTLDAGGHYDVRLEDQSDPAHPDMRNTLMEATLEKTESLLFRVNTASGGKGPARLILFKGNLGLIDEARANQTANQTANQAANHDSGKDTGGSGGDNSSGGGGEDTKPRIDQDKLAAVLGAQLKVIGQYAADEKDNDITRTAVKMFADSCVAHFGDGKALASWANARMTQNKGGDPYSKATGTSPAGSWTTDIGENANVLLNFNNVPVQCVLVASRSHADVTHNEMKLLAGRLNTEGKYKAQYRGGIVNPQTGTLYSMIMLQPAAGGSALQIVASTNTKQGTKSVFSIGHAGK